MPTKALAFKARDVTRAVKATKEAKFDPTMVEVDPRTGCIRMFRDKAAPTVKSELDRELEEFDARHG